jgi:pimeloyl-ACP methyl ester carboxylesterase
VDLRHVSQWLSSQKYLSDKRFQTLWQRQTKDFGHTQADKYSVLILDNRGVGESDKPLMRYSTSEMAKDVIEILDHIGWTMKRELNVVGISMGGMIAQEVVSRLATFSSLHRLIPQATLIPSRVSSLILLSTAARLVNTVGFITNLRNRINSETITTTFLTAFD